MPQRENVRERQHERLFDGQVPAFEGLRGFGGLPGRRRPPRPGLDRRMLRPEMEGREAHPTRETKGLPDSENPMEGINSVHRHLKGFLAEHVLIPQFVLIVSPARIKIRYPRFQSPR